MSSFFSDPSSWVLVAFIIFVIIALVIKAPSMIAKLLDGEIDKIKSELDNARKSVSYTHLTLPTIAKV